MRANTEDLFLLVVLLYGCCTLTFAKTSPEFTVTIDTENFKEIRVPLQLWKELVTFSLSNRPYAKVTNGSTDLGEDIPALADPVNEVSIDVVYTADPLRPDQALQQAVEADRPVLPPSDVELPPPESQGVVSEGLGDTQQVVDELAPGEQGAVLVQTTKRPCKCEKGICSCCSTFFRQTTCAKVGFQPEDFSIDVQMTMNNRVIATRKMPIRDPPPFCFNPRRYEFLDVCVNLNNIHYKNRDLHMCIDLDAGIGGFDLYSWNYSCLKFGAKGLQTGLNPDTVTKKPVRPESTGLFGLGAPSEDEEDDDDEDDDDYDDDGGIFDFFLDEDDF